MKNVYVALENVRSLLNVGAILRTCSFFGVKNVILVGYSGKKTLPNGKVVLHEKLEKTALGSEEDLNLILLETSEELVTFANKNTLELISVEQEARATLLQKNTLKKDIILVFGNEVDGVSKFVLDSSSTILEVKRQGVHNSLNVATTVGVVLYSLTEKAKVLE